MDPKMVRYSRAGDAFHYRWAARRCLQLVQLNATVRKITIEGSSEPSRDGEEVIDLAEYSETATGGESVAYFQLKHTTRQTDKEFVFSGVSPTLEKFGARYAADLQAAPKSEPPTFSFVTNRPISGDVKAAVAALRGGAESDMREKFEQATGLQGDELRAFCAVLVLSDEEENYQGQKELLREEMSRVHAGALEGNEIDGLIALIGDRALPDSDGVICREDVLQRLKVTSERQLFPAVPRLENVADSIQREQHVDLVEQIRSSSEPTIVHATGGVGKTVVASQILESLPSGSWGLVYDCFGAGNYRNESEPRHRAREALVQMANEMAVEGLCRPLLPRNNDLVADLFRSFLERLSQAVEALRRSDPDALLYILIDAADNAETVAADLGDRCFASALLREQLPDGCRLVAFCRTERIALLKPASTVHQFHLEPFSERETEAHLKSFYPDASSDDVEEFQRLTSGNPRVQSNALRGVGESVSEVLESLGPAGVSVHDQIEAQLDAATSMLKDQHPSGVSDEIDAICIGLANLPPFIPLEVLAKAAGVEVSAIRSFVSDLGHPLWVSDEAVQFRDEPTETWFRQKFGADSGLLARYIGSLEPLTAESGYVAKTLPQLLLQAGDHDRVIELALSEEFLPEDNPSRAREIRVYRLQFAFKAALRLGRVADACRLAFRAGEEVAGDSRQLELFRKNSDLVPSLYTLSRVQELAYRGVIRANWNGSENVYSAALLSSVRQCRGEARGYLRSGERWLAIHLQDREAKPDDVFLQQELQKQELVDLGWAHFNLFGSEGATKFFARQKARFHIEIGRPFFERLVDHGRYDEIEEISILARNCPLLIIALADEMMKVGRCPPKKSLRPALDLLAGEEDLFKEEADHYLSEPISPAVVSLCEAAAHRELPRSKVKRALKRHTRSLAGRRINADRNGRDRRVFLRGVALRAAIDGACEPAISSLLDPEIDGDESEYDGERKELEESLGALLPWYYLRAQILIRDQKAQAVDLEEVRERAKSAVRGRYRTHDHLPQEVSEVRFEVLLLNRDVSSQDLENFANTVLAEGGRKFHLRYRLPATRAAFRRGHLEPLREALEFSSRELIENDTMSPPEEIADCFIDLARSILPQSESCAAAYFDFAVEAISKYGDEVMDRWSAVAGVAKQAANAESIDAELTYRFLRCAEAVAGSAYGEDYLDDGEALRLALRLHPQGAWSAMSRWRDRRIGVFDRQLGALAEESVLQKVISPAEGWALSGFVGCNGSATYAVKCVTHEARKERREQMLRGAFRDLLLADKGRKELEILLPAASEFPSIETEIERAICEIKSERPDSSSRVPDYDFGDGDADPRIDSILESIDATDLSQLELAVNAMNSLEYPRHFDLFWTEVLKRVERGKEVKFLTAFLELDCADISDCTSVIESVSNSWLGRVAVDRMWNKFLRENGRRFADEFATSPYRILRLSDSCSFSKSATQAFKEGIGAGLSESLEFAGATTFFGFVCNVADRLSPGEAIGLLDFAIGRFEEHYPPEFGDGDWAQWLSPPESVEDAVGGFIWGALSSPYSSERWQAAHTFRRLSALGCEEVIGSVIGWMDRGEISAFGCKDYPFYEFHGRLYLAIALARTAADHAEILLQFSDQIRNLAFSEPRHVLIQTFAADAALDLELEQSGTYDAETVERLRQIGVSPFPPRLSHSVSKPLDTPWHESGEFGDPGSLSFGREYESYWFGQISDLFGVPKSQVMDLAREIALNELQIPQGGKYGSTPDARQSHWNSQGYRFGGTEHSHGGYPRNDTFSFYYSYHSFLMAASKLLERMPIARDRRWHDSEDPWREWLRRHSLTREDGRWLADRRDPSPVKRRRWRNSSDETDWCDSLEEGDFFDTLVKQGAKPGFLTVCGHWVEHDGSRIENLRVNCALVNKETANSLAASLRSAESPHEYHLPWSDEEYNDFGEPPFDLTGWINASDGGDPRIDKFDPYAREITYPPATIGHEFAEMLDLSVDSEKRVWVRDGCAEPSAINEIWSERSVFDHDELFREGERLSASIELLKQLCQATDKNIVFSVEIHRRLRHAYRSDGSRDTSYKPPIHRIYLLTENGVLKDEEESYEIGGEAGKRPEG